MSSTAGVVCKDRTSMDQCVRVGEPPPCTSKNSLTSSRAALQVNILSPRGEHSPKENLLNHGKLDERAIDLARPDNRANALIIIIKV